MIPAAAQKRSFGHSGIRHASMAFSMTPEAERHSVTDFVTKLRMGSVWLQVVRVQPRIRVALHRLGWTPTAVGTSRFGAPYDGSSPRLIPLSVGVDISKLACAPSPVGVLGPILWLRHSTPIRTRRLSAPNRLHVVCRKSPSLFRSRNRLLAFLRPGCLRWRISEVCRPKLRLRFWTLGRVVVEVAPDSCAGVRAEAPILPRDTYPTALAAFFGHASFYSPVALTGAALVP